MKKTELKNLVEEVIKDNIDNKMCYSLDFGVNDLKNIYYRIWNSYPKLIDYSCDWHATNIEIFKGVDNEELELLPLGVYTNNEQTLSSVYIGDHVVIGFHYDGCYILSEYDDNVEYIKDYIVQYKNDNDPKVFLITAGMQGFRKTPLELKDSDFEISKHYNDDLDYKKIENFINADESGLIILNGDPGTGKTYLLRHLAANNLEKCFLFLDSNMLSQVNTSSFIDFLLSNKQSVIILEDCETLLQERTSGNDLLKTLLNLSDGILGDGLGIKFICTFNADLTYIDKAVLRKGRLKYKYEFGKLCLEKAQALAKELGKEIPTEDTYICDIYNSDVDTNVNITSDNKIGF